MKCRLCDRPTAGAVKLCADCTKAMMRARGASAAQYKPPKARPNRIEFRTATKAALPAATWSPGWRRIAWAAAGLAVIGTFYVSQVEPDRRPASAGVAAVRPSIPLAERPGGDATVATSSEAPSPTAEANAAEGAIARATAPLATEPNAAKPTVSGASTAAPAAGKTSARAGTTSAVARRDSRSSPPVPTPTTDPAADKSKAPAPVDGDVSQLLARASGAQPASPSDVNQVSASAPDKCGNEGGLARFVCEQKTYMQYCENKWDKDPRCMRRTGNN